MFGLKKSCVHALDLPKNERDSINSDIMVFDSYFNNEKLYKREYCYVIYDDVYNGHHTVDSTNKMFMDLVSIKEGIKSLKTKNSEGIDRIP